MTITLYDQFSISHKANTHFLQPKLHNNKKQIFDLKIEFRFQNKSSYRRQVMRYVKHKYFTTVCLGKILIYNN